MDEEPHKPPIAICVNHDPWYGDFSARSVPYDVTANVRRKESPMIRGRSIRSDGRDNRNALRNGKR